MKKILFGFAIVTGIVLTTVSCGKKSPDPVAAPIVLTSCGAIRVYFINDCVWRYGHWNCAVQLGDGNTARMCDPWPGRIVTVCSNSNGAGYFIAPDYCQ